MRFARELEDYCSRAQTSRLLLLLANQLVRQQLWAELSYAANPSETVAYTSNVDMELTYWIADEIAGRIDPDTRRYPTAT